LRKKGGHKVMSMTGFARQDGADDTASWAWEVKSVNGRGLDIRCRVPTGYEPLEPKARHLVSDIIHRGNLQIALTVTREAVPVNYAVNRELLAQLLEISNSLNGKEAFAAPRLDGLLNLRGVLEAVEEEDSNKVLAARERAMESDLASALDALAVMRGEEGDRLLRIASDLLDEIERQLVSARAAAGSQPEFLHARLKAQVEELLQASPALPEERLAQEAALLATKADIREELDRLDTHLAAIRDLLKSGGAIGRKLDFLCQELNREANTVCSKSADIDLTQIGLAFKSAIDRLREQVQNIE